MENNIRNVKKSKAQQVFFKKHPSPQRAAGLACQQYRTLRKNMNFCAYIANQSEISISDPAFQFRGKLRFKN